MSVQATKSDLTLGPLLFNWPPEPGAISISASPTRRRSKPSISARWSASSALPLFDDYIDAVVARLKMAGKTVVRSTLADVHVASRNAR